MAYTKPFKVITDTWLTHDDITELQDNEQDALDTVLGTGHEKQTQGATSGRQFGQHTAKEIPKAVIKVGVLKDSGGAYWNHWTYVADGLYSFVIRLSTGKYRVGVRYVSTNVQYPFSLVLPETDAAGAAIRDISSKYTNGSDNNQSFVGYELTLTEWDSGSSSFVVADYPFTLVAYSVA